jgi:hypothetical protein
MRRPIARTLALVETPVRLLDPFDVAAVTVAGRLLDEFNTEYDAPTSGSTSSSS